MTDRLVQQWNITWQPLKGLKPRPKNRNQHKLEDVERFAKLLDHYGWRHPIIVSNQSGLIVAGHLRYLAANKLGMKEVPVHYQDFKDADEEYAFHVADNASADWAELDLAAIGKDILDFGPDFDVENLGIKDFTIDPPIFEPGTEEDQGQLDEKKIVILECPHCREHFEQQQAKIIA